MKPCPRILVVDDEPAIRKIFSQILEQAGYEVLTAATGQDALHAAREHRPAVVLLDVMLPDANGIELCRQLKQDAMLPDLFVALCSGEASSSTHKAAGLDGGADDYLVKPVNSEELLARIRNLVRLRETTVALRASEQHFRQLLEILPDGVIRFDRHGRLRAVNPQAQAMLGYADETELLQRTFLDLIAPEDHGRFRAEILAASPQQLPHKIEFALGKKNGGTVPVELSVVGVAASAAAPGEYVAVARDITQRRQAEARRAAFSQLGKQLSEADTPKAAAQIIVDCADQMLGWDCCHVRLVAPGQDQLVSILAYDVIDGRRAEISVASFGEKSTPVTRRVLEQGALLLNDAAEASDLLLTPFGNVHRRSASRMFVLLRQGPTPLGLISIQSYRPGEYTAEDLQLLQTLADHCSGALARINTAEALRESEDRFRSLFASAPIGLALHDAKGHFLTINSAYQEMLGYSEAELRQLGVKGVTVPDDLAEGRRLFGELVSGQRNFYRRQKRYRHHTGQVVWAESSASAVRDGQGRLRFIVSMVADITARKQADAEIRQLNETLEWRVVERTRDLALVNAALQDSEQQLLLTLEASNAGVWSWDAATNRSSWDHRYHELYGFSPEEPRDFEAWIARVHPEDRARLLTRIQSLAQPGGNDAWNEEFRATHPVQGERWMAGLGRVLRDPSGQLIRMVGINLDITPRKQAEEAVRRLNESLEHRVQERTAELEATNAALGESETRFRQVAESINEVFWMTDPEKQVMIYVSPAYEKIWGRSCASLQANPRDWITAIHPDDRARLLEAALTKQVAGTYDEQYRILRPSGSLRWIRDRAYPVRGPDGAVIRVVGVAEDITQRKQIEEALRESEVRKGAIMESALDAIITLDAHGRILESNPAAEKMLGHNRARLGGQNFGTVIVAPTLREWFALGLASGFAGEAGPHEGSVVEMNAVRAGGLEFPAELTLTRVGVEGPPLFTAFLRDITAQRRNEEQMRLLADAMHSTREMISVTDSENRFTFVNQAFRDTYGYSDAEILGQTPKLLQPASLAELGAEIHRQTLAGGWQGEFVNRRKDGTEFPIALGTSLIKNRTGQLLGLIGVAQDISERKQAEKQSMAFSLLGLRLSGATSAEAAAEVIIQVASVLFNWDACYLHLLRPPDGTIIPIVTMDTVNGERQRVPSARPGLKPSPMMQAVLDKGPQLINRAQLEPPQGDFIRFGNVQRPSASLMFVPVRAGDTPVGILSIQSYTPQAYAERDLQLLQILADRCGDALRRIEVTAALQVAEAKYRGIVENATEGIFQTTPAGRYLSANPAQARLLGYESPEALLASVTNIETQTYAVPAQRHELKRLLENQNHVRGFEAERVRQDGSKIWMSTSGHAVRDPSGQISYYECTSQDITQRKLAETELRLSHLLIEAQEVERARVARELHDGVNQLIASAKMRLSKISDQLPALGPATREILNRCEHLLVQALEENRRIAHNLRPTDLDHLGLAETCRNFCRELATRANLKVKCRIAGLTKRLAPNLELNLFRIVQEATNNVQKHARAKSLRVSLTLRENVLLLKIQDDGRGFAGEKVATGKKSRSGTGLTNMRERAAALGGTCELVSVPKHGTTIIVRVPATELK